jgi:Domain of unknown function (DUF4365)
MKVPFTQPYSDIGVATVNKIFARALWIFREQPKHDLGIDAHIEIVEAGVSTGQLFGVQIKTGHFNRNKKGDLVLYVDREHRSYWLNYSIPVLLTLCEVETEKVYWQVVNLATIKSTGRGRYKVNVPRSNELTHITVKEIKENLFDKDLDLAITALRKWSSYRILPEPGEISHFVQMIQPGKIPNELLAFILCSAYIKREEIEEWSDYSKKSFSMHHFFQHLRGRSLKSHDEDQESFGISDLGSGVYLNTPEDFIACQLININKEGLQIYVVDIDEPEVIYKPVLPENLGASWKEFDSCVRLLSQRKLADFYKAVGAV